jgi:hypothetical protein
MFQQAYSASMMFWHAPFRDVQGEAKRSAFSIPVHPRSSPADFSFDLLILIHG